MPDMAKIISINFEVFGLVQGVFFRKYTQQAGRELGLRGWCRNTDADTVQGYLEGPSEQVAKMVDWLRHTGSPQSQITSATFTSRKETDNYTLQDFNIRR